MSKELTLNTAQMEDDDDLIGLITSNADASGQYVIFNNGFDRLYAINVAKVEELIAFRDIELTENSNSFNLISGVAKVRGNIIPIVKFDRWLGAEADEDAYELLMVCYYGGERLGLVIKNVLGILSIDSNTMQDNSEKDEKTSFISEITIGGTHGLCLIFDSDKLLMDVFPKIETTQIAKSHLLSLDKAIYGQVLSAEDSSVIRSALTTAYEQLSLDYKLFKDGLALWEYVQTQEPSTISLIITDLEMPVMDGLKLIEMIKAHPQYADIPIIVNTNMANTSVSTKCMNLGVLHIIAKLDLEELCQSIKSYAR